MQGAHSELQKGIDFKNIPMLALITIGSAASIGFGIWHFFVPRIWKWYSYFEQTATELIIAVRAINFFFSLCLVLFGLINEFLAYGNSSNKYSLVVVLAATCVLWLSRVVLQIIYPQGSASFVLQYGMLVAFIAIFLCFFIALLIVCIGHYPKP